jgi:subtilisin family serine protease
VTGIPSVGTAGTTGATLLTLLGQSATVTTGPGNYAFFDGTSMATPHTSAVAALVWSHDTTWTNQQIRDALAATAEDLGAGGRDNAYGHGLIQAKAALDHLQGAPPPPPPGGIVLAAVGYKVKGVKTADLTWTGATSTNVDVRRDGVLVVTTPNDGFHTDSTGQKGGGSHTYQVCEAGTTTCSNTVNVSF